MWTAGQRLDRESVLCAGARPEGYGEQQVLSVGQQLGRAVVCFTGGAIECGHLARLASGSLALLNPSNRIVAGIAEINFAAWSPVDTTVHGRGSVTDFLRRFASDGQL